MKLRRLRVFSAPAKRPASPDVEALIDAHGASLALLATILERERIIAGRDFARSLAEFADLTSRDRCEEGRILARWAACLEDSAAAFAEMPSVH